MQTYTFWKDNRKDQEFTLTLDEVKDKYLDYLNKKDQAWVIYYGHQTVWAFVSSDDGLRSVAEQSTIQELENELKSVRRSLPNYQLKQ
jgi:hypothetical protein